MYAPTWLWRMEQVSHFVCTLVCCIEKKEHTVPVADTFSLQKGFSWFTVKNITAVLESCFGECRHLIYLSLFSRFDVEKECERIDGSTVKQSPAVINTAHPKIKTQVDASCNVLYSISYLVISYCKALIWTESRIVCVCVYKMYGLLQYIQCWHNRRSSSWQIVKRTKAMKLSKQKIMRRPLHTIPGQTIKLTYLL